MQQPCLPHGATWSAAPRNFETRFQFDFCFTLLNFFDMLAINNNSTQRISSQGVKSTTREISLRCERQTSSKPFACSRESILQGCQMAANWQLLCQQVTHTAETGAPQVRISCTIWQSSPHTRQEEFRRPLPSRHPQCLGSSGARPPPTCWWTPVS